MLEIWELNKTSFMGVIELGKNMMKLKEETGRIVVWKHTTIKKTAATVTEAADTEITLYPLVVNLDKNSSGEKSRYLCMSIKLILEEMMSDQETE
jgi:hypothetical protein